LLEEAAEEEEEWEGVCEALPPPSPAPLDEAEGAEMSAKRCLSLCATIDCSSESVTCNLRSLCQASWLGIGARSAWKGDGWDGWREGEGRGREEKGRAGST